MACSTYAALGIMTTMTFSDLKKSSIVISNELTCSCDLKGPLIFGVYAFSEMFGVTHDWDSMPRWRV